MILRQGRFTGFGFLFFPLFLYSLFYNLLYCLGCLSFLDLFFMGYYDFDEEQTFRGGLVRIDVLSKYAVVVPIKTKNAEDVLEATKEALGKMGKKPKMIYTDDERAIAGEDFKDYVEGEGITLHRTRGHPAFAERFIRTYKDMLLKRVDADEKKGKANIQWVDYNLEIMLTYNDKMNHSATGMTPNQARKEKNEFRAMINVASKAKKEKHIPNIRGGRQSKDNEKERNYRERKNFPLAEWLLCCARDCRKVEPTILQIN